MMAALCIMLVCAGAQGAESERTGRPGAPASAVPAILLPNPSFEETQNGKVAGWTPQVWNGGGKFDHVVFGHSGGHSVLVSSEAGGDLGWRVAVEVRPYATYRFTGWIKTDTVVCQGGKGALFNVQSAQPGPTRALTGTNDWTEVELVFETRDVDWVTVNCVLGGWGAATGTAWFDDVNLELVSAADLKPHVTLDGAKTGAPISKYIYGQFIEHLGRCIYGGIWAEMLEDRKFYYEVGSPESPWRVYLGANSGTEAAAALAGAVTMVKDDVYVGEHTPCVTIGGTGGPTGIVQTGLALRKGMEYVGRIVLAGEPGAGAVDVVLIWGTKVDEREKVTIAEVPRNYKKTSFRFTVTGDTDAGRFQVAGRGKGRFRIGAVSLMPADNVHGLRADTMALLKDLAAPVYRWPGGNFVSGYNWRDGLGDPDRRPPRKNPAWKGIEPNDFGIDEFLVFCRTVDTEPYITVNSGLGDAKGAADEVEYANGGPDTPIGTIRAGNGHPESYGVKWWSIGNEMYGNWQLGHMPIEEYVKKHNAFAEAMRAVDPSLVLIAVGATGPWSRTMLARCADHMDLLSEHFYCHEILGPYAHTRQIPTQIRTKAEKHRQYHKDIPELAGKNIPIALDEWNYWYGPEVYGEIGVRYHLKDALGIAAGLHEFARNSDVFRMANYAQTVNVIGAIKTTKTAAAFDTTGLALLLYRRHFGTAPIVLDGDATPLDVAAAWREDRKAVTVGVVNATRTPYELSLKALNVSLRGTGRLWMISGPDPLAYNEPGKEPQVRIEETALTDVSPRLKAPALSGCLYELDVQ
jgi:alpha-N-arabinofuranosidase